MPFHILKHMKGNGYGPGTGTQTYQASYRKAGAGRCSLNRTKTAAT